MPDTGKLKSQAKEQLYLDNDEESLKVFKQSNTMKIKVTMIISKQNLGPTEEETHQGH